MHDQRRVLFLQHQDDCGPGYLGDRARELGFSVEVADLVREACPTGAGRFALVVCLGSDDSVLDESVPSLAPERALLEDAVARGVPVLGVCFGAQLLATVLGGRVRPLDRPEIGWLDVETRVPEVLAPGPWLVWHLDAFECPPGAELLASTDVAVQAFRRGPHLGVQFHPEATPESASAWAAKYGEALASAGVDGAALLAETDRRRDEARERAAALLDRVVNGVSPGQTRSILAS
ncbi:type 1 glutamine amidotransferase [Actinomycetospora cinnamomea]|uniref:GMP synthase-like glutamine amidotransferase n=1 Tax=Actinomycetospora cinnamomea TaxID=663609 RepID=A0A2U1F453_9PSEU|nr:type 1 glutamine amidotransferase [Actinomycetospora cinnamomea]PVZ06942.1 GMP synthase-like glutamine amidotransferase [Actinomycetospora cinnamomea]